MNTIATFRECKLTDKELIEKIDQLTDNMYRSLKIPNRNVPAHPDSDYDLLIGELLLRFSEKRTVRIPEKIICSIYALANSIANHSSVDDHFKISWFNELNKIAQQLETRNTKL